VIVSNITSIWFNNNSNCAIIKYLKIIIFYYTKMENKESNLKEKLYINYLKKHILMYFK